MFYLEINYFNSDIYTKRYLLKFWNNTTDFTDKIEANIRLILKGILALLGKNQQALIL